MKHEIVSDNAFTYLQTTMDNGLVTSTVLYKNTDYSSVKGSSVADLLQLLSGKSKEFLFEKRWDYLPEYKGDLFNKVQIIKFIRTHIRSYEDQPLPLLVAKICMETFCKPVYNRVEGIEQIHQGWDVNFTELVDFLNQNQDIVIREKEGDYFDREPFIKVIREVQLKRNGRTTVQ